MTSVSLLFIQMLEMKTNVLFPQIFVYSTLWTILLIWQKIIMNKLI